jgi:hypothetical protein
MRLGTINSVSYEVLKLKPRALRYWCDQEVVIPNLNSTPLSRLTDPQGSADQRVITAECSDDVQNQCYIVEDSNSQEI